MLVTRNGVYYIQTTVCGQRVRKSLHTKNRDVATKRLLEYNNIDEVPVFRTVFNKVYDSLSARERSDARRLLQVYAMCRAYDFERFANAFPSYSNGTLNRYQSLLRKMLKRSRSHFPLVKVPNFTKYPEQPAETYLTREQWAKLKAALPAHIRATCEVALATGLRKSNILALSPQKVQGKTIVFTAQEMKAARPFHLPISDYTAALLKRYNYSFRFSRNDYRIFKNIAKDVLGINLRFHDLRHTAASWLSQAGVSLDIIGKLLHHTSIKTTERYRHLEVDDIRKYVDEAHRQ